MASNQQQQRKTNSVHKISEASTSGLSRQTYRALLLARDIEIFADQVRVSDLDTLQHGGAHGGILTDLSLVHLLNGSRIGEMVKIDGDMK